MAFGNRDKFKSKANENKKLEESIKNTKDDEEISKIVKEQEKEEAKFRASYKNILWIDDRDDNDSGSNQISWLKHWLSENADYMGIDLAETIWEAVDKIQNCNKYDFVIFDMNLKDSFNVKSNKNSEQIENIFKERNIKFSYDDVKKNHETAGIYLYLLLLSYGYPIDRMLIYTGNSTTASLDDIKKKLYYFNFNENIMQRKAEHSLDLENTYFTGEKNSYYRVRRLVFQACDYWTKNISETAEIKFNKIYFTEKKQESQIEKDSFIDMLERIKMLFPVAKPVESEKVYYQALQIATMYHEKSADITILDNKEKKEELKKFHSVSRYFRNFSAHSKFREKIISADEFALIFCITLRTYFDDTDFSGEFYSYEKNYFGDAQQPKINDNKEIIDKWQNNLLKHCDINTLGKTPENVSIEKLIIHIGYLPDNFLEPKDIMLVLFNDVIQSDTKPNSNITSTEVVLKYPIKRQPIKLDGNKPAEKFFMQYAHRLIISEI